MKSSFVPFLYLDSKVGQQRAVGTDYSSMNQ